MELLLRLQRTVFVTLVSSCSLVSLRFVDNRLILNFRFFRCYPLQKMPQHVNIVKISIYCRNNYMNTIADGDEVVAESNRAPQPSHRVVLENLCVCDLSSELGSNIVVRAFSSSCRLLCAPLICNRRRFPLFSLNFVDYCVHVCVFAWGFVNKSPFGLLIHQQNILRN